MFSENTQKLLRASCTESTWKQYESVLRNFISFCKLNNQNPFKPTISNVLDFLTKLYNDGKSYTTMNTARSALSTLLGPVERVTLGSHPLVCRLLKGASRLRSPQCKYSSTWDPQTVLDYIENKLNSDFYLRQLNYETCCVVTFVFRPTGTNN